MKKDFQNIIIEKITDILTSKDYIDFAYIFGSFALLKQNKSNKNSFNDIDIAVYLSKEKNHDPLQLELQIEVEMESITRIPIDLRIINNAPLSFQYNVIKTGIVIVDRNKTQRSDFEGLTFKKYFDFVKLRNEYLREIPNAAI